MSMRGLLNTGIALACLFTGVAAGHWLRSDPKAQSVVGDDIGAFSENQNVAPSATSLAVAFADLVAAESNLADSSFLQDLLDADAETLRRLLVDSDEPQSEDRVSVKRLHRLFVFGRLAELDPEAAWKAANRSADRNGALLFAVVGMLPDESAAAIAARIAAHGLDPFRQVLGNHPQKALEILKHLPKGMDTPGRLSEWFAVWAEQDSVNAKALLDGLPSAWRHAALDGIIEALLEHEPVEALDLMREMAPDELDDSLQYTNVKGLIAHDIAAVEGFMDTLPNGRSRRLLLGELFAGKLDRDKDDAVAWLKTRIAKVDRDHYAPILYAAGDHPDVLAKLFLKMPMELARSTVPDMVKAWMEKDAKAATAWEAELPAELRHLIEQERFYDVARHGSEETLTERVDALAQIEDSNKRNRALMNLATYLGKQDEVQAQSVLATLTDEARKAELRLAMQWVKLDYDDRRRETLQSDLADIQTPELQRMWRAWAAERLAYESAEAVDLLGEQSEAFYNEQARVVESIAFRWSRSDPAEASAWIASIPASEGKDRAIRQLIKATAAWEPEAALAWAATISDPRLREEEARGLLRGWRRVDVAEASEALANSVGFSDEERIRLALEVGLEDGAQP